MDNIERMTANELEGWRVQLMVSNDMILLTKQSLKGNFVTSGRIILTGKSRLVKRVDLGLRTGLPYRISAKLIIKFAPTRFRTVRLS